MFRKKTIRDDYKSEISEIQRGKRREPKHKTPLSLRSSGSPIDPIDQLVFEDVAWLGVVLDWATDEDWSFEETSDTSRRASYLDSPEYGRRWIIYYKGLKLGWSEVSPTPEKSFGTIDEYCTNPMARLDIQLEYMRFVPSQAAFEILFQAAFYMQETNAGYDAARETAARLARYAMNDYLWDVMATGDDYIPNLEFTVEGPYAVFRELVSHWKSHGRNPIDQLNQKA